MSNSVKKYPVNEIFYSLQGEGFHAGHAAVFIRFSGCNLKCPFCDTDHSSADLLTAEEIVAGIADFPSRLVILTGGEPSLCIDESLVKILHADNRYIAVETNGTNPLPVGIDWITFSPKIGMTAGADVIKIEYADEIKVVNVGQDLTQYLSMPQRTKDTKMYLQPCFVEDPSERQRILTDTIEKVKANPVWNLSAQLHRFLQIP